MKKKVWSLWLTSALLLVQNIKPCGGRATTVEDHGHPSVFRTAESTQGLREPGAYSRELGAWGWGHPGRDANSTQGTITHAFTHYGRYGDANQTVVSLGWRRKPGVPRGNSRRTGRTCKLQQRLDWNPQTRRSEANVCKKSQSGQKFTFQYCRDFKHDKNMRPIFGLVPIFFSPRVRPLHLIRFVNQKIIKIIRIQHSNLHSKVSLSREPCVWAADEGLQRPDG